MDKELKKIIPRTLKDSLNRLKELKKFIKEDNVKVSNKLFTKIKNICKNIKIQPSIMIDDDGAFWLYFKNELRKTRLAVSISEKECNSNIAFYPDKSSLYIFRCKESLTSDEDIINYINHMVTYNFLI